MYDPSIVLSLEYNSLSQHITVHVFFFYFSLYEIVPNIGSSPPKGFLWAKFICLTRNSMFWKMNNVHDVTSKNKKGQSTWREKTMNPWMPLAIGHLADSEDLHG